MAVRVWWPVVQIAILALWLGASTFFAVSVAPALFAVLPSRGLAGDVVGRLLPVIFYSGMFSGVLAIAIALRNGWTRGGAVVPALVTVVACAVAQFAVTPRIERVRAQITGPIEALSLDDVRRVTFGRLHAISVAWLGLAMLASVVALMLAARRIPSA